MSSLPKPSPGVIDASLGDGLVAYDVANETLHHLNRSAGLVLRACRDGEDRARVVKAWAEAGGVPLSQVRADVYEILATFARLGLVDGTNEPPAPRPLVGADPEMTEAMAGATLGAFHRVLDRWVRFRSRDADLLRAADEFLGTASRRGPEGGANLVSLVFDLEAQADGRVLLRADDDWDFPSRTAFFAQVVSVLNEYAAWSDTCLSLHAGAVRSPQGKVLLLPAKSGAGKSTLVASFVAAGWDYLGDEAIGVREGSLVAVGYPKQLSLDVPAMAYLGVTDPSPQNPLKSDVDPSVLRSEVERLAGDVAPVALVVLPRFDPYVGPEPVWERVNVTEAFDALIASTLNTARAGAAGLRTLCGLAESVTVQRVVHSDARTAVTRISEALGPQ